MSKRLVFFGTELFSVPTLQSLIDHKYDIAAIVTKPDARRGRGKKVFVHPIKQIGIDHNITVLQPERLDSCEEDLKALQADAAILVSYGKIISKRILNVFEPIGIINIHPSRLPRYRGPSPIEAAIVSGDASTAISIMKLDVGMDTGPIYIQQDVDLKGNETKPELSNRLSHEGATLLVDVLPDILSGSLQPKPQSDSDVSVTSLISKQDGFIDPTTDDAAMIERKIRAYLGYPKSKTTLGENDVIVTSASVSSGPSSDELIVPCANDSWLRINQLIAPSGRTMSGIDFMNGYMKPRG